MGLERISNFLQTNRYKIWATYSIAHFTTTYFLIAYAENLNLFSISNETHNISNIVLLIVSASVYLTSIVFRNKTWMLALMAMGTGIFLIIGLIIYLPDILRGKSKMDDYR